MRAAKSPAAGFSHSSLKSRQFDVHLIEFGFDIWKKAFKNLSWSDAAPSPVQQLMLIRSSSPRMIWLRAD